MQCHVKNGKVINHPVIMKKNLECRPCACRMFSVGELFETNFLETNFEQFPPTKQIIYTYTIKLDILSLTLVSRAFGFSLGPLQVGTLSFFHFTCRVRSKHGIAGALPCAWSKGGTGRLSWKYVS